MGAGVGSVALEELEDIGVVWGGGFSEWEAGRRGCETGEVLVSWRRCLRRNKDKQEVDMRLRPCLDHRQQRNKRAEAVMQ